MNIKEYIDNRNKELLDLKVVEEENKIIERSKNLLEWGLTRKIFSDECTEGFLEYDMEKKKYYKVEEIDISDEDYNKILELNAEIEQMENINSENQIDSRLNSIKNWCKANFIITLFIIIFIFFLLLMS